MKAIKREMRRVILIGDSSSKRTLFFEKAAKALDVPFRVVDWEALTETSALDLFEGAAVKIDPPSYSIVHLSQMKEQLEAYQRTLRHLAKADCAFFNSPETICRMLDKRETNRRLKAREILVTDMFPEEIKTADQLEETMREKHCYSVFVKPSCFSGAAGVAAFRMHPRSGNRKLYTSCRLERGRLVNTKKLTCMEESVRIRRMLDELLALGCVVERWHPKAEFQGKSYDLRIVFQFGHIISMVARQSRGPITNLHLNNQAMSVDELGLGETIRQKIASVCKDAWEAFSGISVADSASKLIFNGANMAGIDLLLEKGTMRPRIIEMNGQGDLIYQDIYNENRIYLEQVRILSGI